MRRERSLLLALVVRKMGRLSNKCVGEEETELWGNNERNGERGGEREFGKDYCFYWGN